jgi:outer membrane protein assembly factor BamB
MKRLSIGSAVLVVSLVAGLAAQAKPSFTGSWKLSSDPGDDAFISPTVVVAQDEKVLTVTTTGQFGEFKTTYNLDGTDGKSPLDFNGNTLDRTSKLAWDGDKLVLTTSSDFGGQSFEVKQVWSLAADGSLLIESTRPDFQGGGPVTTKATYKKS